MDFQALDARIDEAMERRALPCFGVAVGDARRVLYRRMRGYARVFSDNEPCFDACPAAIPPRAERADEDTLFDMASLTKVLATTMVAFHWIETGRLCLDDTVGMFLDAPPDKRDIMVRQLMTHTGGFHPSFHLSARDPDPAHALQVILAHPLEYEPGTRAVYSCLGYITLTNILEAVGGETLDVLARKLVFEPLGMARTGYLPLSRGETNIAATEYRPELGAYLQGVVHDENARFLGGVSGNAGIFSCMDDLSRFAMMLARGGDGFLSRAMLAEAARCHTPGMEEARGLGFALKNGPGAAGDLFAEGSYGHTGYTGTALFVERDSGLWVLTLSNRVHFTRACDAHLRLRRAVSNAAFAAYTRG